MTRIEPPAWAPAHGRHVAQVDGPHAQAAKVLAARHLPAIWAELHEQIEAFVNDSERCFLHESEGFPLRERLDGQYYVGSERYHGEEEGGTVSHTLWIFVRCLEREWHPNQRQSGYDYLGLEAIVYLNPDGSGYTFDEGLSTSSI